MATIFEKTLQTREIVKVAERLRLRGDELWNIWYDSGIEYLELLRQRIAHKPVFDAQFRALITLPGVASAGITEVFDTIRNSGLFWSWWAAQTWCICSEANLCDKTGLIYALQFNESLIPHFILKQIFNGKQKHEGQPAIDACIERKTTTPSRTAQTANA